MIGECARRQREERFEVGGVCKKTEREEDGWSGECARRQRERRMDEVVSVQEDRKRGGWMEW